MHCQCVTEFGAPLEGGDRPDPVPRGSEVVLRITAVGVCHSDLHIREGGYDLGGGERLSFKDRGMKLPHILGHEPVGRVVASGPDAGDLDTERDFLIFPWQGCGECDVCSAGRENLCLSPRFLGIHVDGAYATHVKIPHPRYLFDIGKLSPVEAAPLACSGLTSFSALKKVEDTLAERPAVLIGAGGLGLMCIGLIRAMGGKPPVVVDIDPAKRKAALEAGAVAAVDGAAGDAVAQVQKAVGGPAAAVVDFVGSEPTARLAFEVIGKGGRIVIVGLYGGAAPWHLPLIPIKSVTIMGSYMGTPAEFSEMMELVSSGRVPVLPTRQFRLDEADGVLDSLAEGRVLGRAVLVP